MLNRAVLPRGVHPLQHNQQRPLILGIQQFVQGLKLSMCFTAASSACSLSTPNVSSVARFAIRNFPPTRSF